MGGVRLRTSDFFKKRRNIVLFLVSVETFLCSKLQLRIGKHLRTFDGTFIKSPEKSDKISRKKRMGYSLRLRAHYRGARRREAPVGFGGPGSRPRARARHGPGPRPLVGPLVDNCMDNLIDRKISYTWISRIYMDIKQCLSINLDSTGYIKI